MIRNLTIPLAHMISGHDVRMRLLENTLSVTLAGGECTHAKYASGSFIDYEQRLENIAIP